MTNTFFSQLVSMALAGLLAMSSISVSHAQTTLRVTTIPEEAATEQVRKFTPLASYLEKQLGTVIAAWLGLVLAVPASRVGQQDPAWLRSPTCWLTR